MIYVVNSNEMKTCDRGTIDHYGVPSMVLMERAALSVVDEIEQRVSNDASILIVCGSGNNGGDGLAIGRLMFLKGYQVQVVFVGNEATASAETKAQLSILRKYKVPLCEQIPCDNYDVIIDSIFGIGLCREIIGQYYDIICHMNSMNGLKVAVDIASGINGDNGHIMGIAFKADLTVTFAFAKIGHLLYPGANYTGELCVKEIGIDVNGFLGELPMVHSMEKCDLEKLPARPSDSNKGSFGKVLVIAGTENMSGAAYFSAKSAYRSGAGLVRILTHQSNRVILQGILPEAVLTTYEESDAEQRKIADCIEWASIIIIGPGLGQSHFAKMLVDHVLTLSKVPCIIDADALNLIAKHHYTFENVDCPLILTPHLGEMARLCKKEIKEIKEHLIESATEYAKEHNVIVVQKDARTITALPDGRTFINCSGNSGMSTGGSGDVLTGIIAGMYCKGCTVAQSAYTGVYLHGLAGDMMAQNLGQDSLIASDIIDGISLVLKEGK